MANYSELIATINDQIKANGNQEITGPVLNAVLQAMVSALGEGYQYMGVATPDTNPGTPDGKVFYFIYMAGNYPNFGGVNVSMNGLGILLYDANWKYLDLRNPLYLAVTTVDYGKAIDMSGNIVSSVSKGAHICTYESYLSDNDLYLIGGNMPGNKERAFLAAYDGEGNVLDVINPNATGSAIEASMYFYRLPSNTKSLKIFGTAAYPVQLVRLQDAVKTLEMATDIVIKRYPGKAVHYDGTLVDAVTAGAETLEYSVVPGRIYKILGVQSVGANGNALCQFLDTNGKVIINYYNYNDNSVHISKGFVVVAPSGAAKLRVFGNNKNLPKSKLIHYSDSELLRLSKLITGQVENITGQNYDKSSKKIRVLVFGSSWFMCTWLYLNKILQSAGINAEIHAYYMPSSQFSEWSELYQNDITVLDSRTSSAKYISDNGGNWIISTFSDSYTHQNYRDDWFADITSRNFDLIAFQQGARQAPYWSNWSYYKTLLTYVKMGCNPSTKIGFNATWTPAYTDSDEMFPQPSSRLGQIAWQTLNNENTNRFMVLSGINSIAPNGALMRFMRDSPTLNTANDLADDGLHPNNGLPMYGLSLCFFQSIIAPMFTGVDLSDVDWLPDTSTQKTPFQSAFMPISGEQSTLIKAYIRQSIADRFYNG